MKIDNIVTIRSARPDEMDRVRRLFLEYADSLGFSLCFQGFDEELAALPGCYAEPQGCILIAEANGAAVATVGLRPLGNGICEMKRLYVQPASRGQGLGTRLAQAILDEAERRGYNAMRLDTHESMQAAIALYQSLGFTQISPYYANPLSGVHYFERRLVAPGV